MKVKISFMNMSDLADILLREGYKLEIEAYSEEKVIVKILEKGEDE